MDVNHLCTAEGSFETYIYWNTHICLGDTEIKKPRPHLQSAAVIGSCSTILDSTAAQLTFQFGSDGLICITRARRRQLSVRRFPPPVLKIPEGEGGLINCAAVMRTSELCVEEHASHAGSRPSSDGRPGNICIQIPISRLFQSPDAFLIWLIQIGTLGVKEVHTFPKLVAL